MTDKNNSKGNGGDNLISKEVLDTLLVPELTTKKNLPPVQVVTVPMFLAKDGTRISTTRIKNSEIDSDGNLLSIDK